MSAKMLKNLLVALGVVVVLWLGVTLASGPSQASTPKGAIATVFDGLTPETVTSVTMARPGDTVTLKKDGGRWTVAGWPADSTNVTGLFDELKDAHVGDLVASNPDNHARMGVADDSAWSVTFDVGGSTRQVLVGKAGPRYSTAYVRMPGEDGVYLLEGNLRGRMDHSVTDWRNKRIARVDTAKVQRLEVTREGRSYTLARADTAWAVAGGGTANRSQMQSMLAALFRVRADGFLSQDDSLATRPEAARVVALGASSDTLADLRFGQGKESRWVRAAGDPVLYSLANWQVERIAPDEKSMTGG